MGCISLDVVWVLEQWSTRNTIPCIFRTNWPNPKCWANQTHLSVPHVHFSSQQQGSSRSLFVDPTSLDGCSRRAPSVQHGQWTYPVPLSLSRMPALARTCAPRRIIIVRLRMIIYAGSLDIFELIAANASVDRIAKGSEPALRRNGIIF